MGLSIIEETPISSTELKAELAKIKKKEGELNFRANKTEDYLNQFAKLSTKKEKELKEKIVALEIPRIKDIHIIKLLDVLPKTEADAKVVLENYPITVSKENLKKIVAEIDNFI